MSCQNGYLHYMPKETISYQYGNLLTVLQACSQLGISLRTLDRWQAKGYITPVRFPSGRRRFSASDVDKLKAVAK